MAIIKIKKELEVDDFRSFCNVFKIKTKLEAGPDGTDEELILEELKNNKSGKWVLNFIDNNRDGYFRLQMVG